MAVGKIENGLERGFVKHRLNRLLITDPICLQKLFAYKLLKDTIYVLINNDLDKHIQAKTNERKVLRFGDILALLSRETKIKYAISRVK